MTTGSGGFSHTVYERTLVMFNMTEFHLLRQLLTVIQETSLANLELLWERAKFETFSKRDLLPTLHNLSASPTDRW